MPASGTDLYGPFKRVKDAVRYYLEVVRKGLANEVPPEEFCKQIV